MLGATTLPHTHGNIEDRGEGMGRSCVGVERPKVACNRVLSCLRVLCLLYPSCPVNDREGQRDDLGTCGVPSVSVCL